MMSIKSYYFLEFCVVKFRSSFYDWMIFVLEDSENLRMRRWKIKKKKSDASGAKIQLKCTMNQKLLNKFCGIEMLSE